MSASRPAHAPGFELVGRDLELAAIRRVLDRAGASPTGLVVTGPAGMGKTTLLRWALAESERGGRRMLVARPTESEAQLAFAGLADLLGEVPQEVVDGLPSPQARALASALRRVDGDANVDPLAISQAVLGVVRHLAGDGPVVLAVDDAPWLDAPTTRVLEYVVRRLATEPVAVIASCRTPEGDRTDAPVARALGHDRLEWLDVGPLDVEDLGRMLADRFGQVPRRAVAVRIRDLSGGNPFYALELARAFDRADATADPAAVAVPESLAGLVRDRLGRLSPEAFEVVLVVAAAIQPTRAMVIEAAGDAGDPEPALSEAIAAGVLEGRPDGRLAFSHPLLAWSAYASAPAERRLAAHRRLSLVASDPDERVRHRAITAIEPDEGIAVDLEAAAERANDRGAPETARDLELEALRLTPAGHADDVGRRTLAAAEFAIRAADGARARTMLERLVAETPPGPARARPLALLADIRSGDDWEAKLDILRTALAEADADGPDWVEIELAIGVAHWMLIRDIPAGLAHLRAAVEATKGGTDRSMALRAIGSLAFVEAFSGDLDVALARIRPAIDAEASTPGIRLLFAPSYIGALLLERADRPAEAKRAWLELLERADRMGDADSRPLILVNLAATELALGHLDDAAGRIDEAEIASDLLGHDTTRAFGAAFRAHLEARRGDETAAREAAARGIALARATHAQVVENDCRTALALLELSLADHRAAAAELLPAADRLLEAGVAHSPGLPLVPLAAEAAAVDGAVERARALLERLKDIGERLDHASTLRAYHVGRALLAAGRGDLETALDASRAALVQADRVEHPFERARTLLVHAEVQRRLRHRAAAREAAAEALAGFEALGARLWVERARSELARAGQATGDAGPSALTPTQREVAALVARGRTNREVAATLFMSPHTVEAHLTNIYRTLGIRNRTDLARVLTVAGADQPSIQGDDDAHD